MMKNLSKKTDEELVLLAQAGNMAATEELLKRHSGLVKSCAHRYFLVGGETEDLFQEGMLGLYRAIGDYDANRKDWCSFKNFAYLCISRKILDAVKKASKAYAVVLPIDIYMAEDGMDPEEILILNDEQKEFRQKMSRELSDFEFKVTTMYMDGMTCAEICEATGKSAKSVDNALQRSKAKLLKIILKK
jgi:RNA polymerase sporulation-specific sigma factor